jgi:transcription termination factor NusB
MNMQESENSNQLNIQDSVVMGDVNIGLSKDEYVDATIAVINEEKKHTDSLLKKKLDKNSTLKQMLGLLIGLSIFYFGSVLLL